MATQIARYKSTCPVCHRCIKAGDTIARVGSLFVCSRCYKTEGHEDPIKDANEMAEFRHGKRRGYINYAHYETAGERAERSMEATGGTSDCMYDY